MANCGAVQTWSLSGFGNSKVTFPNIEGCCSQIYIAAKGEASGWLDVRCQTTFANIVTTLKKVGAKFRCSRYSTGDLSLEQHRWSGYNRDRQKVSGTIQYIDCPIKLPPTTAKPIVITAKPTTTPKPALTEKSWRLIPNGNIYKSPENADSCRSAKITKIVGNGVGYAVCLTSKKGYYESESTSSLKKVGDEARCKQNETLFMKYIGSPSYWEQFSIEGEYGSKCMPESDESKDKSKLDKSAKAGLITVVVVVAVGALGAALLCGR